MTTDRVQRLKARLFETDDRALFLERMEMRHPEEYRTLSVRVVGYSAYFVTLTQEAQDDIIRRTEYAF